MNNHQKIVSTTRWGTYGKAPDIHNLQIQWVLLKDLSDTHIQAILTTQSHIDRWLRDTLQEELICRIFEERIVPDVDRYPNVPTNQVTWEVDSDKFPDDPLDCATIAPWNIH